MTFVQSGFGENFYFLILIVIQTKTIPPFIVNV